MSMRETIARCLRVAREARGITQSAASSISGIPERTIRIWEAGQVSPPSVRLAEYLEAIGVLTGKGIAEANGNSEKRSQFVGRISGLLPEAREFGLIEDEYRRSLSVLAEEDPWSNGEA